MSLASASMASMRATKVYVAGPMTGLPEHNFPAFVTAAAFLRLLGYHVTSPHELDNGYTDGEWVDYLKRDIIVVMGVDVVVTLPGWRRSRGARLEVRTARAVGIPVISLMNAVRWSEKLR